MYFLDPSVDELTSFNEFMKNNALWIALTFLVIIIIAILLIVFINIKKNKQIKSDKEIEDTLLTALGGKDNIKTKSLKGTRITITLNDFSKLNEEMLNDLNVSYIKMSEKITIVSKNDSIKLDKLLS